jgi:TM2 domain-containing membrane protein YozV
MFRTMYNKQGMELVQVAILVGIAMALGLLFAGLARTYVNNIFNGMTTDF